jgi:hypothetical protein
VAITEPHCRDSKDKAHSLCQSDNGSLCGTQDCLLLSPCNEVYTLTDPAPVNICMRDWENYPVFPPSESNTCIQ